MQTVGKSDLFLKSDLKESLQVMRWALCVQKSSAYLHGICSKVPADNLFQCLSTLCFRSSALINFPHSGFDIVVCVTLDLDPISDFFFAV